MLSYKTIESSRSSSTNQQVSTSRLPLELDPRLAHHVVPYSAPNNRTGCCRFSKLNGVALWWDVRVTWNCLLDFRGCKSQQAGQSDAEMSSIDNAEFKSNILMGTAR